jgi:hypothetical protein
MINQNNFDWSVTKKDLSIFIPNYGRGQYIRNLLDQFATKASIRDYSIVIGNDGIHEDFSDLADRNIFYFTLERENTNPRNGCFIRNFFIKRCKSHKIFQKDPETEIRPNTGYDWINEYINYVDNSLFIRPSYTLDLGTIPHKIENVYANVPHRVHWGFLSSVERLQYIRGYDQDFTQYGYEDTDLYYRLQYCCGDFKLDKNLLVIHHPHPIDPNVYQEVNNMATLFYRKSPKNFIRNSEDNWGNG